MSKFKVGDKVRIGGWCSPKDVNYGKHGVITEVENGYNRIKFDVADWREGTWHNGYCSLNLTDKWLELLPSCSYELHITCFDGKTTNAVYKVNGKIEKRAEAVCAPSDTFDFATGAQTAFDRVFPKATPTQPIAPQEDKPKFKVGDKVKFTNTKTGFKSYLIGKTFEIVNLQGALDDGFRYGIGETFIALESEIEPYAEPSPFDWDAFKAGKVAVHCDTEEKAKAFVAECHANKITWPYSKDGTTHWNECDSEVYYSMWCGGFGFSASGAVYRNNRLTIVEYPFATTPEPEKEPEPVYYSGKVVCVEAKVDFLTKGKPYTFKNGLSTDDVGDVFPFTEIRIKNVEELSERGTGKFIPYLGEA